MSDLLNIKYESEKPNEDFISWVQKTPHERGFLFVRELS